VIFNLIGRSVHQSEQYWTECCDIGRTEMTEYSRRDLDKIGRLHCRPCGNGQADIQLILLQHLQ
jgi:hypothetical protein